MSQAKLQLEVLLSLTQSYITYEKHQKEETVGKFELDDLSKKITGRIEAYENIHQTILDMIGGKNYD